MSWFSEALKGNWGNVAAGVQRGIGAVAGTVASVATGNFVGVGVNAAGLISGSPGSVGIGFFAGGIPAKPGEVGPYKTAAEAQAAVSSPTPQATPSPVIATQVTTGTSFSAQEVVSTSPSGPIVNRDPTQDTLKAISDFFNGINQRSAVAMDASGSVATSPAPVTPTKVKDEGFSFTAAAPYLVIGGAILAAALVLRK
jgi:hypothetical protein